MKRNIQDIAYEKYQFYWMMSQGLSMKHIYELVKEHDEDPDSNMMEFKNYLEETGFNNGCLWVCKEEFLQAEYKDAAFMKTILSEEEFTVWREDNQYDLPVPDLTILTPDLPIIASVMQDTEYPGVSVEVGNPNGINPGVIMEYDPTSKSITARIYGKEEPEGEPIAVYSFI